VSAAVAPAPHRLGRRAGLNSNAAAAWLSFRMDRVAELVRIGDYEQALVRLWVLAGEFSDGTLRLNAWERARDAGRHDRTVADFLTALQREQPPSAEEIAGAPLAFLVALDQVSAMLRSAMPFVPSPYSEGGRQFWLVPVEFTARQTVPLARQTGNREAWCKWHAVFPARTAHGIEVAVTTASGRLAEALHDTVRDTGVELPVWIGHLQDGAQLTWELSAAGRFRCGAVLPAQTRVRSILHSLERAAEAGALVVVLPELTVDLAARAEARRWLGTHSDHSLEMVVAGSFHEETPDGWYNTAEMWDRFGERILVHRKLRPFGAADGLAEDVNTGNHVTVLVTPIGSFAVLICKDFLDDHESVATLLQEVPVDWVLVPSYGDEKTSARHKARAQSIARVSPGASCVVAHQRNVEASPGDELPGFAHQSLSATPTVVGPSGGLVTLRVSRGVPGPDQSARRLRIER